MSHPRVEAFKAALAQVESYELPESSHADTLVCPIPDFRGNQSRRLRFLIRRHGVAFDIFPPGPNVDEDSALVMQMGEIPEGQVDFPSGDLPKIFDSQLQLKDKRPYMLHARYDLYQPEHEELLTRAGLGDLVVAHLRPSFGIGAPYGDFIDPVVVDDVPWVPHRLHEMAIRLS